MGFFLVFFAIFISPVKANISFLVQVGSFTWHLNLANCELRPKNEKLEYAKKSNNIAY